jgi:hypothetical protein
VIHSRFEFTGADTSPLPDHVYRDAPIIVGTVELYGAQRYLVASVDYHEQPPKAVMK